MPKVDFARTWSSISFSGEKVSVTQVPGAFAFAEAEPMAIPDEEELMRDEVWGRRLLRALRKSQRGQATGRTLDEYLNSLGGDA